LLLLDELLLHQKNSLWTAVAVVVREEEENFSQLCNAQVRK
jgi:hypothetical protein